GPASSFPSFLQSFLGSLFFAADDGMTGQEWWITDGTAPGTGRFLDLNPTGSSSPRFPVEKDGRLFFNANDGTNGAELWMTDGTSAGTMLVGDINPGPASSDPIPALALGSRYLVL